MFAEKPNGKITTHCQAANVQRVAYDLVMSLGSEIKRAKSSSSRLTLASKLSSAVKSWDAARQAAIEHKWRPKVRDGVKMNGHASRSEPVVEPSAAPTLSAATPTSDDTTTLDSEPSQDAPA